MGPPSGNCSAFRLSALFSIHMSAKTDPKPAGKPPKRGSPTPQPALFLSPALSAVFFPLSRRCFGVFQPSHTDLCLMLLSPNMCGNIDSKMHWFPCLACLWLRHVDCTASLQFLCGVCMFPAPVTRVCLHSVFHCFPPLNSVRRNGSVCVKVFVV